MKVKTVILLVLMVLAAAVPAARLSAVTMSSKDFKCQVCGVVNQFQVLMSWGSYVYAKRPVEIINWPFTTGFCWYMCRNCYYSDFMSNFDKLPKEKAAAVREALDNAGFKEILEDYRDVPVSRRLEMVGTVYSVLEKDDEDLLRYNLALAFHYNREGKKKKAEMARKIALKLTARMLPKQQYQGLEKKLLLTSGAMKHLLGDNKGALADFKEAQPYTFYTGELGKEDNEDWNRYYSEFLDWYIDRIKNTEKTNSK